MLAFLHCAASSGTLESIGLNSERLSTTRQTPMAGITHSCVILLPQPTLPVMYTWICLSVYPSLGSKAPAEVTGLLCQTISTQNGARTILNYPLFLLLLHPSMDGILGLLEGDALVRDQDLFRYAGAGRHPTPLGDRAHSL
jgi:hypothetical protein